ncbi:MAG: type II toxin-antitoxin system HicB family antitoxin [Alphaproteobacteria bacterium]|nr:type II toxin-antitoxin system HicB family antitoxin [Alphaproteobacteria bacterium]
MAVRYFPAIIEGGDEPGYCVFFPDLPGCTSAGDTIEQAALNAEDALRGHLAMMIRDSDPIPDQRPLDQIGQDPEVTEVARIMVRAEIPGRAIRLNISMDDGLVEAVDHEAAARGMTRSGFLAEAARRALAG